MHLRHGQNNIPIELLRSFIQISEHGSFSQAAQELGLTQPAISAQIKRLQGIVGGDLFVKTGLGVGLSSLGLKIEPYIRRLLAMNDQVMAIAGRVPEHEMVRVGIQNVFARHVLAAVWNKVHMSDQRACRYDCGSVRELAEKLKSGYVDVALMMAPTESRRNQVVEWSERLVWIGSSHVFPIAENEPIPFVGRQDGFMDRKVLHVLEEREVPYRIVFQAGDLGALIAAIEAGMGFMIGPERFIPEPLVANRDRLLPKLPEIRAAVYLKEGFDFARNKSLVEAFVSAVIPPGATPIRPLNGKPFQPAMAKPVRNGNTIRTRR